MIRPSRCGMLVGILGSLVAPAVQAGPDSLEITCDVDRTAFRSAAKSSTSVIFRLWNAESGGSQCGSDHTIQMAKILGVRPKGDAFDGQRTRRFLRLHAVLGPAGDSGTPVQLCSGDETWVDVTVGPSDPLTCDFGADPNSKQGLAPDAPARRRLQSAAYAKSAAHADSAGYAESLRDVSVRAYNAANIPNIPDGAPPSAGTVLPFGSERWDTDGMHDAGASADCGVTPNRCRLTAQTAGKYLIFGHVEFDYNPLNQGGIRSVVIRVNGRDVAMQTGFPPTAAASCSSCGAYFSIQTHYELGVGDYAELVVAQTSGAPLSIIQNGAYDSSPEFGMVKLP